MRSARCVCSILILLALSVAAAADDSSARFEQDRFAIGFWVDPPLDAKAPERYKEIADAHFTLVIGGFGGSEPEQQNRLLKLCKKNGLRALVAAHGQDPAELPDGPACWGYGVRDEPKASDFPALRAAVDAIRAARPGKLAYINLFPNYADPKQLGTETYEEHVARFMEEVRPDVLSMDHYPIMKPGEDGRAAYCENLAVLREYALQHDVPFWNFFNCMPYGPHADPTEAQLRWQVYTSVAHGARGVLYFCYYTPLSDEFPKGGAIITRDDRRTRHYYEAQRINAQIKNLGPTLMKLSSTGVCRITPEDDPAAVLASTPVKDLARAEHDPKHDFLVGLFTHEDGREAVLLNNYRFDYAAWPTVVFGADLTRIREVSKETGKEIPVLDDSPDMDGLQLSFDVGEGRLFLIDAR